LIDPAILRPGRLDVKIKIERPDEAAAADIFAKYLTPDLPIAGAELAAADGDGRTAVTRMIATVVEAMFSLSEANRLLEVTYANGENETLYFKDFASGAMIESIVRRAKKLALKRFIQRREKGLSGDDLVAAVREEFKENEDLPNTSNPDDWAKIAGRKRERIVSVKLVPHAAGPKTAPVERVVTTGQYL
jgi:proteasome-associated ATPase